MLKLKLQYFGHLMWTTDSLEKSLMLGKIGCRRRRGDRGWDGWMASPLQWTWTWALCGEGQGGPACCNPWDLKELDTTGWLNSKNNHTIQGLPGGSDGKESACNVGEPGLIPGSGRSPGEGNSYPAHYSCLENLISWTEKPGRLQSMGLQRLRD